ncbi:NADP-dependent oxidoreductase domain-containing protein [Armillaria novae-zelandiae]|uniref:NADP-dependent oxidoreductase domain-containing protein n=1 Tax=Armillaria novae-zelandiae TaxID=153914 RepID=A0AA39UJR8_9AGAR|nr:NADP-dependent oxidoreductase domain-containing protein [Armillaria novae-zelandiae]
MSTVVLKRTNQKVIPKPSCADTVYKAIKAGYRLFDGAGDYGNEKESGEGVRRAIADGLVKREDLYVHALAKKQLELWGIDYFDLFLIHFPVALQYVDPNHRYPPEWWGDDGKVYLANTTIQETWTAMEELVDAGVAKNIGISNFQSGLILDLLRYARYEPQVLQVELHPYLNQQPLVDFCKAWGIAVTAYSSFGPQGYIELGMDKSAASLFSNDAVQQAAAATKKTPGQVILRWATQRGIAGHSQDISSLNINLRLNDPILIDPRLSIFA